MTSPAVPTLICPQCGSSETTIGASGNAMCLACTKMWDPSDPAVPVTTSVQPFQMAPVEEVFAPLPEPEPESLADRLEGLMGGLATLEGGQHAEIVSFTTHDSVIVRLSTGDLEDVDLNDVTAMVPPVEIPDPVALPTDPDAVPPDMALSLELAKLIIRGGAEAVNGTGETITPGVPPVGFLPADPDLHAVIERAAGLAVGMLLDVLEADVDAVLAWVGAVAQDSQEGNPTTEETADDHTSETT